MFHTVLPTELATSWVSEMPQPLSSWFPEIA